MVATAVLIEFVIGSVAEPPPQLASCEETLSILDGKWTALRCILDLAICLWPEFLCTAARITMVIGRPEELQCSNTAEVVIMWA